MSDLTLIHNDLKSKGYESTLRELSWSRKTGSQERVTFCNSNLPAFNFDQFKEDYCRNLRQRDKSSFDALVLRDRRIYCVEFKNQKPRDIDNQEVRDKYKDGVELLSNLFESHRVNPLEYEFFYCVVFRDYPEDKSYRKRDRLNSNFDERKQDEGVKFGLLEEHKSLLESNTLPKVQRKIHERIKISTRPKKDFVKHYRQLLVCKESVILGRFG